MKKDLLIKIIHKVEYLDDKLIIDKIPYKYLPSILLLFTDLKYNGYYTAKNLEYIIVLNIKKAQLIYNGCSITTGLSLLTLLLAFNSDLFDENFIYELMTSYNDAIINNATLSKSNSIIYIELINGLTGIANYFSICNNDKMIIKSTNLLNTKLNKYIDSTSNINYGLSHGISGPLMFLSKSKYLDLDLDKPLSHFNTLVDKCLSDETWYCKIENFKQIKPKIPYSWCYGFTGLLMTKYFISKNFYNNKDLVNLTLLGYSKHIEAHLNDILKDNSIICHGSGGVLIALKLLLLENNDATLTNLYSTILEKHVNLLDSNFCTLTSNLSFLDGDISILLSLISGLTYSETITDKILFPH